jgi:CDGSH-type Zn-finger protein/uncharacterized Fe-S cluster protein YjdI
MGDGVNEVRGKSILVRFEGARCIHSRNCVLGRPDVFVPNAPGEWIHPDAAPAEEVAALARACPSGAIRYERLDGGSQEEPPPVNLARVRENGPLAVHAALEIEGHAAEIRATLCRCGASKNKPYCDGSHVAAGFQATGEPEAQGGPGMTSQAGGRPGAPSDARGGKLEVTPIPNGPLLVRGNLEVVTGTGHTIWKSDRTALCRCGGSSKKPFCDGTHNAIRFRTDA